MSDQWEWWWSNNEENYHGPCGSREEAIATGFNELGGEGWLFIVEATKSIPGTDIFDFEHVIEEFCDRNEECWGEEGEPVNGHKFKDKKRLEGMLAATLRNYLRDEGLLTGYSFGETRNAQSINMETGGWMRGDHFQSIMLSAFRYALGRKTVVCIDMVNALIECWDRLGHTRQLIVKEINEAVSAGTSGMEIDVVQWARVLAHDEETRRVDS